MRTTPPGAQALGGLPGDPQGGSKPLPQGQRAVPPPTPAGPLGGLCGGRSHEAGFSKGLRCSWPFVCMNYRCPPPKWQDMARPQVPPTGVSPAASLPWCPLGNSPPPHPRWHRVPRTRLGFHSAQNEGGGRAAGDRSLIPQRVCAEQEGPRGWQARTGERPEGRGWGRSPEGVARTWSLVPKACPTNRSPEIHSSDHIHSCRTSSSREGGHQPCTYF